MTASHTTVYSASAHDLAAVGAIVAAARAKTVDGGELDTGAALLAGLGQAAGTPSFTSSAYPYGAVPAEWIVTPETRDGSMILYLHGRRFQFDEPAALFGPRLSKAARLPVLVAHYRLAPEFPYPAAVDDVLNIYQSLLAQGFSPGGIALVGHSSGATLALSALIRLAAEGRPMPAAVVALSAITDFTFSGATMTSNQGGDIITPEEALQVRSAYLAAAPAGEAPQSPLFGDLTGLPPILLISGGAELFLDDAHRFADRAAAAKVDVSLDVFEGLPHAFCILPLDAAEAALRRIGLFVLQKLAGDQAAQPYES